MIIECIHPAQLAFSKRKNPREFQVGEKIDVDDKIGENLVRSGKWKNTNETITPEEAKVYAELEDPDEEPVKKRRRK
jgi:hypothetical protein